MIARIKANLIKYFFFGNSITDDGYWRLAYLVGRFIVFLPLSLCATLILGVYSIFRPVKIFMLRCDRSKISFIVEDLEVALRIEAHNTKISGTKPARLFAVLDCDSPNRAFTAMYGRVLPFLDDDRSLARGIIRYAFPFLRIRRQYLRCWQSSDQMTIWASQIPIISWTTRDRNVGHHLENKVFANERKEYICIGLPEKIYYETKIKTEHPISRSSDLFPSFPSWENYFSSADELIKSGYQVLRMGQMVENSLPQSRNPGIIDYANNFRSEFGDVWLLANCKFAVSGNGTGFYWISAAMNKPVVLTDLPSPQKTSYGANDIFLPLLALSRSDKKLLPFSWLIKNIEWATNRHHIEGDVEIIKNTAEEITEVVLEMNQRLDGTWIETVEDVELQNRFKKLRENVPKWQVQEGVRIGADFLRRYQHLL
jgi:putative glycosyltransferase (TIGR04372 family)